MKTINVASAVSSAVKDLFHYAETVDDSETLDMALLRLNGALEYFQENSVQDVPFWDVLGNSKSPVSELQRSMQGVKCAVQELRYSKEHVPLLFLLETALELVSPYYLTGVPYEESCEREAERPCPDANAGDSLRFGNAEARLGNHVPSGNHAERRSSPQFGR